MAPFREVPTAVVDIRVGGSGDPQGVALRDGGTLGWEGALSFSLRRDREQLAQVTKYRHSLTEDQSKYISPEKVGETVRGAVVWKTGEADKVMSDTEVTVTPTSDDLSTPEGVAEWDSQDSHSEQIPLTKEQSRKELERVPEELSKEEEVLNQVMEEMKSWV